MLLQGRKKRNHKKFMRKQNMMKMKLQRRKNLNMKIKDIMKMKMQGRKKKNHKKFMRKQNMIKMKPSGTGKEN